MRYKRIPYSYDWEEIISQLQDEEMFDEVSDMLDNDILSLKDMDEIPWTEIPDGSPMEKTGLYVNDEGDGYYNYIIVYNGTELYSSEFHED
jgi:hypothetical protein